VRVFLVFVLRACVCGFVVSSCEIRVSYAVHHELTFDSFLITPSLQMNNCVGAGNMKHFLLFLIYTWTCSVFCLLLLGWNYFFCTSEQCAFGGVLTQLVRIVTLLSIGSFLFVRISVNLNMDQ
jgi:hypothetical protein